MPSYRLYRLDGAGKIIVAEWIEAASDEEALRDARNRGTHEARELWERDRLVGRLPAGENS